MVRVQDEEHVEHALEHGVGRVLPLGHPEQHAQEVARVAQIVVGVHVRQPAPVAIRVRRQGRHLRYQPEHLGAARLLVVDGLGLGIERRERGHGADEHAHRMGVVAEAVDELPDVLVHHRVERDVVREVLELAAPGSSPLISRYDVSRYVDRSASCSIGYPRYRRMPLSPSMYVMRLLHDAVFMNAGS